MEGLTNEQIIEVLNTNEEVRGQLLSKLPETDFGKQFLDNYATNFFESKIGEKIGEVHGKYDEDFSEVFGVKKPDGVKSYQFWKEKASELKQKIATANPEQLAELKRQNEELQKKIESNDGAKHYKDLYESLQANFTNEKQTYESKLNELQNSIKMSSVERELNSAMSKLKFNDSLPKELTDNFVKNVIGQIMSEAQVMDDGSVFYYENGKAVVDPKTASKVSAEQLLSMKLQSVLAKTEPIKGGGGQEPNPGGGRSGGVSSSVSGAKSQTDLHIAITKELIANGVRKGTDDWTAKFDSMWVEYSKDLPLR